MKNAWKTVPLEALAVQQKGAIKIGPFGSQLKKCDLVRSGIHVIGIENVLSQTFDGLGERFISPEKFQTLRTVEILPGDLLITMMGTIGRVAVVPDGIETSIMDSHLLRVRPDASLCRTDYLRWAINGSPAVQQSMDAQAHGAIMKGLNSAIVRSLPIYVPPLPEQQRIVAILDEAFAAIAIAKANAEKNLQNARALFESHLQSVFSQRGNGWVEKPMGEVCEVKDGTHDSPKYVDDGIPFVTQKNIREDGLSFEKTRFIRQEDHEDFYRRSNAAHGDILISMIGANRGMACIVDDERVFSIKNVGLVKQNPSVNQHFLLYFLKSPQAASYVQAASKGGAQEFVGLTELRRFPVPLPSLERQNTLAESFQYLRDGTQRLARLYERMLAALDALKKSLLHQAFTGEL